MENKVLSLKKIAKSFSGVEVLRDINLAFERGEVHAICGENGAGKSTMMKIIAGALRQTTGEIIVDGSTCKFHSTNDAKAKGVYMIHQELNFVPELSVMENISLGRYPARGKYFVSRSAMRCEAENLLKRVSADIDPRLPMKSLSVAQAQMVEIAKCLRPGTRILIMDEPTAALTEKETETLFDIIRDLKEQGVTILYISHRMDEIFQVADRITVLRNGDFIGTKRVAETNYEELIHMMIGRDVGDLYPERSFPGGQVVYEVRNISGEKIEDISFTLQEGEILGITGLFGSGTVELAKTLYGAYPARGGTIYKNGEEIHPDTPAKALRCGIGFVSDDRKREGLLTGRSIKENISLSSLKQISGGGFIRAEKEAAAIDRFMKKFRIKARSPLQETRHLSGGNQQKVVFSRLEMGAPDICILAEPTRGVDVGAKAEIYALINDMTVAGRSVILVSSDLAEIVGVSDRVLVMRKGRIVTELAADKINQQTILSYASGGVNENEA
ncbi:MAG: sugar ABC transporter ATP-binding protein [Eubacteriales bacterium]|nr:sugar ABC transporter ATP-binding protein [Eubacteriales bacterium]